MPPPRTGAGRAVPHLRRCPLRRARLDGAWRDVPVVERLVGDATRRATLDASPTARPDAVNGL